MAAKGVGSILVLGSAGELDGIVTDRDLRNRVLAEGRSADEPVTAIMTTPVITVSPEAFVFEALLEMTRRDIHHLPVVEGGRVIGMLSSHDLLLVQAATPLELGRVIQSRQTLEELEAIMPELTRASHGLFEQGLTGYEMGRIVSELNDLVIRRVLVFAEAEIGAPPGAYCWLVLGSEGRREQTLRTDQDNALVYADPTPLLQDQTQSYFTTFAERVIAGLIRLGYPPCPAGSMASNPQWCQPLAVWRAYFDAWVRDPDPQHLLYSSIYFDFRPIAGAGELAETLRNEIRHQIRAWRSFPRHLGKIAVSHAPPLGLFRRFVLERTAEGRGIDVKLGGMLLLVNALRAYAVELGLDETNTIERLHAAARVAGCFTDGETEDVRQAYETLFHFRLRHQLACIARGKKPDNFLDPYALSSGEQRRLREAFRTIRRLQGKVESRYFTEGLQ